MDDDSPAKCSRGREQTAKGQTAKGSGRSTFATTSNPVANIERPDPVPARRAVALLCTLYRREQLTRELAIEQRRYGRNYWDADADGRGLAALRTQRQAMLAELNAEANAVLADLFPGVTSEPIALGALFDDDRPGPNVTFLSGSTRARLEAELLAEWEKNGAGTDRGMAVAERVLPSDEQELFRRWNAPAHAALREQLVGFAPNETEFLAILRANDGSEAATNALAATLGAGRFHEFLQTQDPAVRTARQELRRNGLPIAEAEWLATTRAQAVSAIAEVWRNAAIPDTAKPPRVAQLERTYSEAIGARLNGSSPSLDGIGNQ